MKLNGIIYISEATLAFDEKSLEELSQKASLVNEGIGVSGYLYFDRKHFMQYIEGERFIVQSLMDRIQKDSRHDVTNMMKIEDLETRKFPSWHMKYLTDDMLSEIKMEYVLMDYIAMMKNDMYKNTRSINRVWKMVDKISSLKVMIS